MDGIEKFLEQRRTSGLLRELRPANLRKDGAIFRNGEQLVDFSSNDYLGLASHPKLKEASKKAIEEFGTGSSASRLLSGDLTIHHELEEKIALFKGKERALVFNSGYQANVGIISSLYKEGDVIFSDKLNHASIMDGISLSGAKIFRFAHNDLNHLEALLKKSMGKFNDRLIVTETIFSMDGDRPPLKQMVELKGKYDCRIMVDEAHATGVFGKNGSGVVAEEELAEEIDFIIGTFGKALGSFGAYMAGSKRIIEYLINACRSFIYSTALPPCVIAANIAALEVIKEEPFRREVLLENAAYFRGELEKKGFEVRGSSQIVPLIVGDAKKAVVLSKRLEEKGYWSLPIRPPTVTEGQSRLRFSLSYCHDRTVLQKVVEETGKAFDV